MTQMKMLLPLAFGLCLSACGQVFNIGQTGKESLYQLEYDGKVSTQLSGPSLFVDEPVVRAGINGDRVMVQLQDGELARMEGARWTGRIGGQLRSFFVDQLRTEQKIVAHGVGKLDIRVDCRLMLDLNAFELHAVPDPDEVVISLRAGLINMRTGDMVEEREFTYNKALNDKNNRAVVRGFRVAALSIGRDMGAWLAPLMKNCAVQ